MITNSMITTLAQITVYQEAGIAEERVSIDGDMNYLGQGIAASMEYPEFADTVIAAIDFYRRKRGMSYAKLITHIENRVKILTNPGSTTAL